MTIGRSRTPIDLLVLSPLASLYGRYVSRRPDDSPEFEGDEEPRAKAAILWSMHPIEHASEPPRGSGE